MANALHAFGTRLLRNGTQIAEIQNVGGPNLSRGTIDVTHHQSPAMWREFIKDLKDGGDVTFDINYNPVDTTHNAATGLLADFANNTTVDTWAIVFPNVANTTWTFPGILTGFQAGAPHDGKLTASVTIKVAGQPTLA